MDAVLSPPLSRSLSLSLSLSLELDELDGSLARLRLLYQYFVDIEAGECSKEEIWRNRKIYEETDGRILLYLPPFFNSMTLFFSAWR